MAWSLLFGTPARAADVPRDGEAGDRAVVAARYVERSVVLPRGWSEAHLEGGVVRRAWGQPPRGSEVGLSWRHGLGRIELGAALGVPVGRSRRGAERISLQVRTELVREDAPARGLAWGARVRVPVGRPVDGGARGVRVLEGAMWGWHQVGPVRTEVWVRPGAARGDEGPWSLRVEGEGEVAVQLGPVALRARVGGGGWRRAWGWTSRVSAGGGVMVSWTRGLDLVVEAGAEEARGWIQGGRVMSPWWGVRWTIRSAPTDPSR